MITFVGTASGPIVAGGCRLVADTQGTVEALLGLNCAAACDCMLVVG